MEMTFNAALNRQRGIMRRVFQQAFTFSIAVFCMAFPFAGMAETTASPIGIVIMHGKGGSPTKHVSDLASSLEGKGYLVANLEMPWSGRRDYDVDVSAAEREVQSALEALRSKGAKRLFVAGHSQGGVFALYFGSTHIVDGVIAIAPGGSVSTPIFREKLGESVALARKLIDEGRGSENTKFFDYEGGRGAFPVLCTPSAYFSWFDPDGAMDEMAAIKKMNSTTPVLFIAPTGDYPALQKIKQRMFGSLPSNPLTRLYEPASTHLGAPSASVDEIERWTMEVTSRANTSP
jgi:pimeloyl-ACP methyl ester carboxylesterase